jgi:hypothetical protein
MKPSLPSTHTRDPLAAISRSRGQVINWQTKAVRSSIKWINPAIEQHIRLTSNYTAEDDLEPNIIINELMDKKHDIINSTANPLHSSLLYVKSITSSAGSQNH